MCNRCTKFAKIVVISPMRNICTRFGQDCSHFSNAQYMRKICTRLYLFRQCAIDAQDLRKILLLSPMHNICPRFAKIVLLSPMHNICARFAQDCSYSSNAQYMARFAQDRTSLINEQYMHTICPRFVLLSSMSNICARLYIFLQCEIYAQDFHKIAVISPMCNRCAKFAKIVVISPMRNICTRFGQDCSHFSNAQYMHKICTRLYLFCQCAIDAQDLCKILLFSPMHNICPRFAKIVLLSPMHNICTRFVQNCTSFHNAQYMHKIC